MRTIGVDLAITGRHQAVVVDEQGNAMGRRFRFATAPAELEALLRYARTGVDEQASLQVVMEPTGLSWLPVACYFVQRGVTVYLVNTQRVADPSAGSGQVLRKYYSKHAKSDRISARVLARLPWADPDALYPLHLAGADHLSGQRWCKQLDHLTELSTAIKNRVQAWERAFWPGLEEVVDDLWAPWMRRWREEWYDPWRLQAVETPQLAACLVEAGAEPAQAAALAGGLQAVARRAVALYGTPQGGASPYVDYATLQDQVLRELRLLAVCEDEQQAVQRQVRTFYRRLHPSRDLETIKGVGEEGAAVYVFFIGEVERFVLQKEFRGWHGIIPESDQSGDAEKKGLRITKAGPALVKHYAYMNAEVARQWDPQIAAIYWDQMVRREARVMHGANAPVASRRATSPSP